MVAVESYKNVQFHINTISSNTTYTITADIKTNVSSNFTIIERNPNGDLHTLVNVPASNTWRTFTLTHTTTADSTKINFLVNPTAKNSTIYIDNIRINIP